jgi:hypothetical protein
VALLVLPVVTVVGFAAVVVSPALPVCYRYGCAAENMPLLPAREGVTVLNREGTRPEFHRYRRISGSDASTGWWCLGSPWGDDRIVAGVLVPMMLLWNGSGGDWVSRNHAYNARPDASIEGRLYSLKIA